MPSLPFSRTPSSVATTRSLRCCSPSKRRTSGVAPLQTGHRGAEHIHTRSARCPARRCARRASRERRGQRTPRAPGETPAVEAISSERRHALASAKAGSCPPPRRAGTWRATPGCRPSRVREPGPRQGHSRRAPSRLPLKNAWRSFLTASMSNLRTLLGRMASLAMASVRGFPPPRPFRRVSVAVSLSGEMVTAAAPSARRAERLSNDEARVRVTASLRSSPISAALRSACCAKPELRCLGEDLIRGGHGHPRVAGLEGEQARGAVRGKTLTLTDVIAEGDDVRPGGAPAEEAGGDGLHLAPCADQAFTEQERALLGASARERASRRRSCLLFPRVRA